MNPSPRPRVAIESPYAGEVAKNTEFASKLCRYAVEQGKNPFAMHLFFPQFLSELDESERNLGIECGLAWTDFAEEVWFCLRPTEKLSRGMLKAVNRIEGQIASGRKVAIRYLRFSAEGLYLADVASDSVGK